MSASTDLADLILSCSSRGQNFLGTADHRSSGNASTNCLLHVGRRHDRKKAENTALSPPNQDDIL